MAQDHNYAYVDKLNCNPQSFNHGPIMTSVL